MYIDDETDGEELVEKEGLADKEKEKNLHRMRRESSQKKAKKEHGDRFERAMRKSQGKRKNRRYEEDEMED
ncbi:hypothetical protein PP175_27675 (plasmid) [Aneurinibacillus sp. Ricciae_BoGa-3]|uniref:hypothetical protein n=1 Tax=Aneurinibacillus sp. Ricciae_BoGa-3 TaxID=3022697 RepID=UPI00233FD6C7|nr:hypothetical protein [Aneurinibacillus sp. Ricciae_BoGa-3]WCK56974.1 hypothetical protein PP175_27675 [Aneurinibacillus sp. Ricciae_BoGa-3]